MSSPQKEGIKKAGKVKAKKRWAQIVAPKSFNHMVLGESHVETAEQLVGKSITANLMTLSGDMRAQGVEIRFDVTGVQDGKGVTAVTGYEMLPSAMKRLVRRGRAKVADSFVVRTSTGRLVRIKPVVLTANPASSGAQTTIRLAVRDKTKAIVKSLSFDTLIQDVISYKFQRALRDVANKTHPVKNVEIRVCQLLPEGAVTSDEAETVNVVEPTADAAVDESVADAADGPAAEDGDVTSEDDSDEE